MQTYKTGWAERLRLGWALLAAIIVALSWAVWRRYKTLRAAAAARKASVLRATQPTGEAIELAEEQRIHLRHEANAQALQANAARDKAERIASRVQAGGHQAVADLIRSWNSE